jgi:ORF6N domain
VAQTGNAALLPNEVIINKIYLIRDQKIMLDKDLAELYKVTTSYLNKTVKRNLKRFPDDFMFQLTADEFKNLMFHFGTSSLPDGKAGWGKAPLLLNRE